MSRDTDDSAHDSVPKDGLCHWRKTQPIANSSNSLSTLTHDIKYTSQLVIIESHCTNC